MDSFSRLTRFIVGLMLSAIPLLSLADTYSAVVEYRGSMNPSVNKGTSHAVVAAAQCQQWGGASQNDWRYSPQSSKTYGTSPQTLQCFQPACNGGLGCWGDVGTILTSYICPYGGTVSGANCINAPACPSGQARDSSGQCAIVCPAAGTAFGGDATKDHRMADSGAGSFNWSSNSCAIECDGHQINQDGSVWAGGCKYTGQTSTGSDTPVSGTQEESPCSSGTCPGTVNGNQVCLPCKGAVEKTTGTTTHKDASGTVTGSTKSETTTTTDANGRTSTITTTTTYDANGNPTGTTIMGSSEKPGPTEQAKFCEDNPASPMCKISSASATCNAQNPPTVTCDGDAVACEILEKQTQLACDLHADSGDQFVQLGQQVMQGNDPERTQYPTDPSQVDTRPFTAQLDDSGFLGSGAIADVSFSFQGQTFVIPFSETEFVFVWLGHLVVAFAFVAAARITFA